MKAVIVDIKGKYAAALDTNGNIVRVSSANYVIGQKIDVYTPVQHRAPSMKKIAAVASVAALALTISTGTVYAMPYGTVSLDAAPAIEYTINRFDYVLEVKALNEEAEAVLAEIDEHSLRHQSVEQAVVVTIDQIEASGYLLEAEPPVQITANTKNIQHSERLQTQLEDSIREDRPSFRLNETSRESNAAPNNEAESVDGDLHPPSPEGEYISSGQSNVQRNDSMFDPPVESGPSSAFSDVQSEASFPNPNHDHFRSEQSADFGVFPGDSDASAPVHDQSGLSSSSEVPPSETSSRVSFSLSIPPADSPAGQKDNNVGF